MSLHFNQFRILYDNPLIMSSEGNTIHYVAAPLSLLNGQSTLSHMQQNPVPGSVLPAGPTFVGGSYSLSHNSPPTNPTQAPPIASANILKISNLPPDISIRECHLIFALVNDDIMRLELNDYVITAYFKTLATCITSGKLLDGKHIFGIKNPPIKVEFDSNSALTSSGPAFENLRLGNSANSPSSSHQISAQQLQGLLHLQPASSSSNPGFDNFQKRASVGSQRLRFPFSDPFSGSANANALGTSVSAAPGTIVLGDLSNKSLMMMNPSESRDFDTLSRDPWAPLNLAFASNPQTPGISTVGNGFDWTNSGSSVPANAQSNNSHTQQQQQQQHLQPQHSVSQSQPSLSGHTLNPSPPNISIPLNTASGNSNVNERRRTSAFFNGGQSTTPAISTQSIPPQAVVSTNMSQEMGLQQKSSHSMGPTASVVAAGPTGQAGPHSSSANPLSRNGGSSTGLATNNLRVESSINSNASSVSRTPLKDVPDLSLLAKVPPPANPADQNPPCNTLYVGNLPPDATEAELRALFSPQKGFRRLSFRTKNLSSGTNGSSSSHNHGPMCFVEFDDVLLATEALADLYGSALPRANGSSSKGGIRLSFSKNPLGVRGPGNPRRSSANQVSSANGNTNNGVGNYGYLNYR